jgi:hypothetical protein
MGASIPLTLSVDSVTALRAVAEQPSEVQRFEVARRSRVTKPSEAEQLSVLCTDNCGVGEQGIEP